MIQLGTIVNCIDNTGVLKIMCIRVLGKNSHKGKIGDIFVGVVKNVLPNRTIKRSSIVRCVIARTKNFIKRKDGTFLRFKNNACILIDKENHPLGNRIFGPVAKELREKNFKKIISLSINIF